MLSLLQPLINLLLYPSRLYFLRYSKFYDTDNAVYYNTQKLQSLTHDRLSQCIVNIARKE